jgi:mono/diheme cytochrome c family protein
MKRASRVVASCALILLAAAAADAQQKTEPKKSGAAAKAEENYAKICQPCHGPKGKSPLPTMSLVDGEWKHGSSTQQIAKTIAEGVAGTAMLPNKEKLTKAEILALARLVRSFDPALKPEKAPAK